MTTVDGSGASAPATPAAGSAASILTLQDVVSHLMDVYDLQQTAMDVRRAKRSALWGFEQALSRHQWGIYDDQFIARFSEQDTDGEISINANGVVTRATPAWPSWSTDALIYLAGDKSYRVLSRESDTQLILENWDGSSLSLTDDFSLRQDRVIIPQDVREVYDVFQSDDEWSLPVVDVKTFRDFDRPRGYQGSEPSLATFRTVVINGAQQTEMRVSPATTKEITFDVAYMRRATEPKILESVVVTSVASAVTLASPMHVGSSLVGSLLRVSASVSDEPEAELGYGLSDEVPVAFEGFITEQSSTTEFTCPGVPDLVSAKAVLTDILDTPRWLLNAVKMYSEAQMARIGRGDMREYRTLMLEADEQLRYAMEQDSPFTRRGNMPSVRVDSLEPTPFIVSEA